MAICGTSFVFHFVTQYFDAKCSILDTNLQALQLNSLDFDAAISDPIAPKNAAWVYESELFPAAALSDPRELEINHETLYILSDILRVGNKAAWGASIPVCIPGAHVHQL